jgi:hypothetical protein
MNLDQLCFLIFSFLNLYLIYPKKHQYTIKLDENEKGISSLWKNQQSSVIHDAFPKISDSFRPIVPTYLITQSNDSEIHRFFDSSPLSPSNRYLAVTRTPGNELVEPDGGKNYAYVIVYDLIIGKEVFSYPTLAWDTQVGAHVQWGANDSQLLFNILIQDTKNFSKVAGVVCDMHSMIIKKLDGPIYHVRHDGQYAASPDLTKISNTQRGYGVIIKGNHHEVLPTAEDGFYITRIYDGKCRKIILLKELASLAGVGNGVPTVGFHAKWSSDGKWIMLVMRTLELSRNHIDYWRNKRIRRQHLFVISFDDSVPVFGDTASSIMVKYIHSWSSQPVFDRFRNREQVDFDGNHPNWIAGSHNISFNMVSGYFHPEINGGCKWSLAVIDIHTVPSINFTSGRPITSNMQPIERKGKFEEVYPCSSGHPNFIYGGRYAIIDSYTKESSWFTGLIGPGYAPLRLIDSYTKKSVTLLQVIDV